MPKKKTEKVMKQITVRVTEAMYDRIEKVANALDIDSSDLIRMLFKEQMPRYEERAREAEKGEEGDKRSA